MHNKCLFITFILVSFIVSSQAKDKTKLFFSHERGFYTNPFELRIADTTGALIKYTLDGTNPFTSSSAKSSNAPVILTIDPSNTTNRDKAPCVVVTACAVVADTLASNIVTHTYLFPNKITSLSTHNQVPGSEWLVPGSTGQSIYYGLDPTVYNNPQYKPHIIEAFTSIPTLSIVTDLKNLFSPDSGIYVNAREHGEEWERAASLELLNPDSTEGFQINCGLRIRGGWSRNNDNPKHAFRVFFNSTYGKEKLKYPIFGIEGANEFDKFDIQCPQNYSWSFYKDNNNTFLRELFSRDSQRDMGQPYTRGKFYHLYINGTYWGLYQIQERAEANFGASYLGGNGDDYDVIKVNTGEDFSLYQVEATNGTLDKWRKLWDIAKLGFDSDDNYFKAQGLNKDGSVNPAYEKLLDLDNLIDYMLITFLVGDFDAPVSRFRSDLNPNNYYGIYNRVNPDGFKFFRHDAEHTMFDINEDRTGPYPAGDQFVYSNPQWIHQRLMANAHYRLKFSDRVFKHFFNNGALTEERNIARIEKRKNQIENAIIAESARWGDASHTQANWYDAVNYITDTYLPQRNSIVLQQFINKGLFTNIQPPTFNSEGGVVQKGFNLELSAPSGDIYYTLNGTDPCIPYEDPGQNYNRIVVNTSSDKKVIVPTGTINAGWRTSLSYDDSQWLTCSGEPGGIGYESPSSDGYESYIKLSLLSYMFTGATNPNTSCYIRIPFEISADELPQLNRMNLQVMYDDGFVAYINGIKVAEVNAPATLSWNSPSSTTSEEAASFTTFDISNYINRLKSGTNLLAIQGLNVSTTSSDFLILPKLEVGKYSQSGTISPDAIKYSSSIPISKTTHIKTRAIVNSSWTPLNEAMFIIDEDLSSLRITELHYHPLDLDTIKDSHYEFIELKNVGSQNLILNGAAFVIGVDYSFPDITLAPNDFFVIASDSIEFFRRYGFMPDGEYSGQLDNSGERVVLVDAGGDTVISVRYNDKLPWPEDADGAGYSLVSKSVFGTGDPNTPEYWVKSNSINGSPGADDVVSEVTEKNILPKSFELYQNFPNPFNPETKINFALPKRSNIKLVVYDILGREVITLAKGEFNEGNHSVTFNANNLSSGIYYYNLSAEGFNKTNKMVMIR